MIVTLQEIEAGFAWGKPKEIDTKRGPRILRKAPLNECSRNFWSTNRNECSAAGVMFSEWPKGSGQWSFSWFQALPPDVQHQRHADLHASRATDADVEIPRPDGLEYMPFQRAGIAYMRGKPGVLLADEMGLGKTIQIIGWINEHPEAQTILIVAPSGLLLNWLRELRKWLVNKDLTIAIVDGKAFPTTNIVLIGYPMCAKWQTRLDTVLWDLVALDEAHNVKNKDSQRARALLGYKPKRTEPSSAARAPIQARMRIAATGTPICNYPQELYPLINFVRPDIWSDWWSFANRYCGMEQGRFGATFAPRPQALEELQTKLRQTTMVRRLKRDVLTDLPAKVRSVVTLPCPPDVLRAEREIQEEWDDELSVAEEAEVELAKAGDNPEAYASAVERLNAKLQVSFEAVAKIRAMTAVAKIGTSVDFLNDELDGGVEKCLVFAHHIEAIDGLVAGLENYGVLKMDGRDSMQARQAAVDRFQNDPTIRVMVLGIIPGGVGWTLTAANYVYFHELDWRPGIVAQAEDRAHRIGQRDTVFVKHIVLDGTIDAKIAATTVRKQEQIERALDRRHEPGAVAQTWASVEASEPVRIKPDATATRVAELERIASRITPADTERIHAALRTLSDMCDGARKIDGAGFSKLDVRIGHDLAARSYLSPKQAALGYIVARKYHRQIGELTLEAA